MKNTIVRRPVLAFFLIAFSFSWLAVLPLILNPSLPVEPFQILGSLAGPTLAAVIVIAVTEGRTALVVFFKRYIQWRAGIVWWLIVLFGVLIALNLVAVIFLGPSILTEFFNNIGLILPTYLLTLVAGVILGPLWEEPGWRGFALPRLQHRYGPLPGSILLGAIWAIWHAPGYLGGWMQSHILALLINSIAFSIVATWIYNNTRGSILLMILFHSSSNAAIAIGAKVLPPDLPPAMHTFVYGGWIPTIMDSVAALLILILTKGRLSFQTNEPGLDNPDT